MTSQLLTTKLHIPPSRPDLVTRPRLISRMNEGSFCKLILVSAPAGFGKSTLISEWSRSIEKPVSWLSIDENDNILKRFLTYLVATFQVIEDTVGESILATLEATDNPPLEPLITLLINEISASENEFFVVLDDYHLISANIIHNAIDFFLEHLPPNAHLVISGRVDPPIAVSRLRARGEMIEIRSTDLRFNESEVSTFLNDHVGLNLSPEDLVALLMRTEGWITGLRLAALSMRGREDIPEFITAFSGSHHYIIDYLVDEVMVQQSEEVQNFLCKSSILNRFNASLCDSVLEITNSKQILQDLDEANLFLIPLDDERIWYRYHHLFADVLHAQLREREPENVSNLHLRATQWLEKNEFMNEAINHALAGKKYEHAAKMVESIGPDMMMQNEFDQLTSWLDMMPKEIVYNWPWLCIIRAWMCQRWANLEEGEEYLLAAEQAIEDKSNTNARGGSEVILGQVAAIRSLFALVRGQIPQANEYANNALDYLPKDHFNRAVAADALGIAKRAVGDFDGAIKILEEARYDSLKVGNRILAQAIIVELGRAQIFQGRLKLAAETFRDAVELEYRRTQIKIPYASAANAFLAEILLEWNDLDLAKIHLEEGVQIGQRAKMVDAVIISFAILSQVHLANRDIDKAKEAFKSAERIASDIQGLESDTKNFMMDSKVRILLAQNQFLAASRFIKESGFDINDEITFTNRFGYLSLARVLTYSGRENLEAKSLQDAQSLITRVMDIALKFGVMGEVIELLVLQAIAYKAQNLPEQALESLEEAIILAEPEGYIRTFVDEGEPIKALLSRVTPGEKAKDYASTLLVAFDKAIAGDLPDTSQSLVEPLSKRELDVLKLLATDLSGPDIAEELYISYNTLRTHMKSIFSKLGVNNRRSAVRKAKELNII